MVRIDDMAHEKTATSFFRIQLMHKKIKISQLCACMLIIN